jgi:hypothetical protein
VVVRTFAVLVLNSILPGIFSDRIVGSFCGPGWLGIW